MLLDFVSLHFKASYISYIIVLCASVMRTHCFSIIFRDLSQRGLTCQVLNLRFSHFRKLNMVGKFIQLRSLNLDFSSSLTSLRKDCFTCMPNLNSLSLCETRIANLWTTSSALLKLPSLVELRFQKCSCCDETGPCPSSTGGKSTDSLQIDSEIRVGAPSSFDEDYFHYLIAEEAYMFDEVESDYEDSSDDSEVDFTNHRRETSLLGAYSEAIPEWNGLVDLQTEVNICYHTFGF